MTKDSESDNQVKTKVGALINKYPLGEEYGKDLEARWLGENRERESLRDLAERFNHDILSVTMDEAGMNTIEGEVGNILNLLNGDEVNANERIKARRRLERNDIDVKTLEQDFVSYQAIRTYLKDYRGARYEKTGPEDRINRTIESIDRLQSRIEAVCESNIDQLRDSDALMISSYQLFVNVTVTCEECGSQYTFNELMERRKCSCFN